MSTRRQRQLQRKKSAEQGAVKNPNSFSASYSGPLPPPSFLNQFEQIVPGSAERIIQYSEREQAHRHKIEDLQTETIAKTSLINARADAIGRVFGVFFLMGTFGVAVYFSVFEKDFGFATLFYSPSIIFAIISLIKGRKK